MPIYKVQNEKKDGMQKYNVRINYTDDSGKPRSFTRAAYGKQEAEKMERDLTREIETQKGKIQRKITIQQLYEEYEQNKRLEIKESTITRNELDYRLYISPTFNNHLLESITVQKLQRWKLDIAGKDLALNSKKNIYSVFRAMLNHAVKLGYMQSNPIYRIGNFKDNQSVKKDITIYTAEQFTTYIKAIKQFALEKQFKHNTLVEWHYYVYFNILFYTGLRSGEAIALKWSDITGTSLSVKRSMYQRLKTGDIETLPKNKTSIRSLQIPLPLMKVLEEHKKRQEQLNNFSEDFRICGGEKCIRYCTVFAKNKLYAKLSEQKKIRIHDFRHSHASLLANAGINIQEVARRLGHARVEETWNTYSHMYPQEEVRALEVLNKVS